MSQLTMRNDTMAESLIWLMLNPLFEVTTETEQAIGATWRRCLVESLRFFA